MLTYNSLFIFLFILTQSCTKNVEQEERLIKHSPIAKKGTNFFNHAPQIAVLTPNDVLPCGKKLHSNRIVVSAMGGIAENNEDQRVYTYISDDNGRTFSSPYLLNTGIEKQTGIYFSGCLVKLRNNRLVQFYLRAPFKAGSEYGKAPLKLRFKTSENGAQTWSSFIEPKIAGLGDDDSLKLGGPISHPVTIDDTLYFALHYRYIGKRDAYLGILKCSQNLNYFELKKQENISIPPPEKLIEPSLIAINDTLFTYFRTSIGYVYKSYSTTKGENWSKPVSANILNPSSPVEVFEWNKKIYMIGNISTEQRDNLAVLSSRDGSSFLFNQVLAKSTQINRVAFSYPNSCVANNSLYTVFSEIYPDYHAGGIAGDIRLTVRPVSSLNQYSQAYQAATQSESMSNASSYIVGVARYHHQTYLLSSNGYLKYNQSTSKLSPESGFESLVVDSNGSLLVSGKYGLAKGDKNATNWQILFSTPQGSPDGFRIVDHQKNYCLIQSANQLYFINYSGQFLDSQMFVSPYHKDQPFNHFINKPVGAIRDKKNPNKYHIITQGGFIWETTMFGKNRLINKLEIQGISAVMELNRILYLGTETGEVYAVTNYQSFKKIFSESGPMNFPVKTIKYLNGKTYLLSSHSLSEWREGYAPKTIFTHANVLSDELLDFYIEKDCLYLVSRAGITFKVKA